MGADAQDVAGVVGSADPFADQVTGAEGAVVAFVDPGRGDGHPAADGCVVEIAEGVGGGRDLGQAAFAGEVVEAGTDPGQ